MINGHWIRNTLRNRFRHTLLGKLLHGLSAPQSPGKICFIAATRLPESEFWNTSPLGIGLKPMLRNPGISARIVFQNTEGLPLVYNKAIEAEENSDILVFLHDDLWLKDKNFIDKIRLAVQRFDIVGVAGNTRRSKHQPAWLFRTIENNQFLWDDGHLSGSMHHGNPGHGNEASIYGPSPAKCELLDGVLLAGSRQIIMRTALQFDERFMFHFYDMDFCRQARRFGLRLGTWPIELIHQSGGSFGNPAWKEGHIAYMKKWKN